MWGTQGSLNDVQQLNFSLFFFFCLSPERWSSIKPWYTNVFNAGGCQRHFSVKHLTRALKNWVLGSSYNVLSTLQVKKSVWFCGWKTKCRHVAQEDILKLALLGKEELTGTFYASVRQLNWGDG